MCRPALIILPEALLIIKYFALYGYFYEKLMKFGFCQYVFNNMAA